MFPAILKELRARDVRFLDGLFKEVVGTTEAVKSAGPLLPTAVFYSWNDLIVEYARMGLSRMPKLAYMSQADYSANREIVDDDVKEFTLTMSIVRRHNIFEESTKIEPIWVHNDDMSDSMTNIKVEHFYSFTVLGAAFVSACRKPS